ncbi:MAG: Tfp pilus assembly protein FimT/FimU [Candidatus Paceibacteria bacterium]
MNTQTGYSILELLVTVAIVGVIGSLALVQYQVVGQSTKLNGETISAVGLVREMQSSALSPEKPSGFGDDQNICGYVIFEGGSYTDTLTYHAVGTTGSATSSCDGNTYSDCYTNSGASCGNTEHIVKEAGQLQLQNSEVRVPEQIFFETPFAYTQLGSGGLSNTTIELRNNSNSDITRTITIEKGGFITAQDLAP